MLNSKKLTKKLWVEAINLMKYDSESLSRVLVTRYNYNTDQNPLLLSNISSKTGSICRELIYDSVKEGVGGGLV